MLRDCSAWLQRNTCLALDHKGVSYHQLCGTTAVVLATQRGEFAPAIALSIVLLTLIFLVNLVLTNLQQRESRS